MATIIPKVSVKELADSFVVYDCTGKYSSSNQGGLGINNPEISTVESAKFEITPPGAVAPIVINVFPDFPRLDDTGYEIDKLMVGPMVSGKWKIKYTISGTDTTPYSVYTEKTFVLSKTAECCVEKFLNATANVPVSMIATNAGRQKALELSVLLENALWAKECGQYDNAHDTLTYIQLQCKCASC